MEYYETLKPVRSKTTKVIITIAITVVAIPVFFGALIAVRVIDTFTPDKSRHVAINWAKDRINITDSGRILLEKYDNGDPFLPTGFRAELEGKEPYESLFAKVQSLPNSECKEASPRPSIATIAKQCRVGPLEIQVRIEETPKSSRTIITFEDSASGRKIPDPKVDGQFISKSKWG